MEKITVKNLRSFETAKALAQKLPKKGFLKVEIFDKATGDLWLGKGYAYGLSCVKKGTKGSQIRTCRLFSFETKKDLLMEAIYYGAPRAVIDGLKAEAQAETDRENDRVNECLRIIAGFNDLDLSKKWFTTIEKREDGHKPWSTHIRLDGQVYGRKYRRNEWNKIAGSLSPKLAGLGSKGWGVALRQRCREIIQNATN